MCEYFLGLELLYKASAVLSPEIAAGGGGGGVWGGNTGKRQVYRAAWTW
jgi:hypothetical protein